MKSKKAALLTLLAAMLGLAVLANGAVLQQTAGELFEKALYVEEGQGDLQKAIGLYQDIVKRFPAEREIAAKSLLHVGICYEKLGKTEARSAYSRLLRDYGDQLQPAKEARSRLAQLEVVTGRPAPASEGLIFRKIDFQAAESTNQVRLSPDGSRMLYIGADDKQSGKGIRIADLASGKSILLAEGVEINSMNPGFAWSPDGKKVVFRSGRGELRVVDSTGGTPENLWSAPDQEADVFPLDWSEKNQAILIALPKGGLGSTAEKLTSLAILPEKGGVPRTVVSGDMSELTDWARFSPDGTLIVGMKRKDKNTDIYVWTVDDGVETRVTDHAADDECPLWSPDGKTIVFVSNRAQTTDLWAVPMAGPRPAGDPIRIQTDIGKNRMLMDMTRSGHLLFLSTRPAAQPPDLFVMSVDPKTGEAQGPLRPFARYPAQSWSVRWSPDGSRIAYTSRRGNIQLPNVYVSSGGTEEELEIPAKGYWIGNIEWARDGKHLLFPGWNTDNNRVGIYQISLESLSIEPVQVSGETSGPNFKGAYVNIRWLPLAGRYMFGNVFGETEEELYLMDPATYKIDQVGGRFSISGFGIPSPDGRYLVGVKWEEKKVCLLTLPDGVSRDLCPLPQEGWSSSSWSPDGKKLVWGEGRALKILSVPDGTIQTLVEVASDLKTSSFYEGTPNTAWSPDSTRIAYAVQKSGNAAEVRGELWVVEAAGGSAKKIADAPSSHPILQNVVWHPSGKLIYARGSAAESKGGIYEHWVMENFLPTQQAAVEKDTGELRVRQVWAGPWYGGMGAPSRDGAYVSFRADSEDLAIRDLATGKIRQLTKHQSPQQSAYQSIPSPDGKQVAYCWYNDGRFEVRSIGVDGAEPRVLYSNAEVDAYPSDWSPDGESILTVLARKDRTCQIALVSLRDTSVHLLKSSGTLFPTRPRFSPDGRYIAYSLQQSPKPGENDIFVLALDGGGEIPLVEHPANDVYPDWSPDGKRILFLSNRTGTMGAWWIRVAEGVPQGTPELVKPDLGEDLAAMGFTRNGSYYYGVHTDMSDVYIAELDLATGKLISAPSPATQRFVGSNSKPDWSPDGRQLLFLSKRGPGSWGARAFCVRSTESGEVHELTSKLDRMPGARWSPDGRSLLGMANHPTDGIGLFRIDVQTGDFVAVPRPPGHFGYLSISPDGKSMIYMAEVKEPKRYCVMARDLETGTNKELYCFTDPTHFASRLTLSPDGSQVAFVINEVGSIILKVMPVAGGEARDLLRGVQIPFCEAPIAWSPDGQSLLFLKQPQDRNQKTELWLVPVQRGEPRKLELAREGMIDICLHPDGRHVAFTSVQNRDGVWVLENFPPKEK